MTIEITAWRWVPPFAQGYVKDLRLRWALEEAGIPYTVELIDGETQGYRAWQPFGQVPAYRDGELTLFESGAIVLRIAARSEILSPADPAGAARVSAWVFAALNSIEPFAQNRIQLADAAGDALMAKMQGALDGRLTALAAWLGDRDYLEDRFTAGDLVMALVLRELADDGLLGDHPTLAAYVARCLARPAFARALEAQMQVFRENTPD